MHVILDHHEIIADLTERCTQLAERYSKIFGGNVDNGKVMATLRAGGLAQALGDPTRGLVAATDVLTHLVPEIEKRGTDFWGSPLGRACGWWTGAGQLDASSGELLAVTPQPRVALLLGMSRQSAFEMVVKGRLKKLSPAGVAPEDVRREMQARFPL
jgi:hypothetical protein